MADFNGIRQLVCKRMLMKQHSHCHFLNIRLPFIFQIEKYFCHKFLPRNKAHEQGGKHDKTQNKREASSQRLPVS